MEEASAAVIVTLTLNLSLMQTIIPWFRVRPNGIDINISKHHTVSVSNFQSID